MISVDQTIRRTDLVLPRFLAVILFGLAAFMGIPMVAAAVVSVFHGKWIAALLTTLILPIVWASVWLGTVIWSGRSIPKWFFFMLGGLISVVPTFGLLMKGEWMGALASLVLIVPFVLIVCSAIRPSYMTTAKPKALDDELA